MGTILIIVSPNSRIGGITTAGIGLDGISVCKVESREVGATTRVSYVYAGVSIRPVCDYASGYCVLTGCT